MKVFGPEEIGKRKHTPVIEAPEKVKKDEWFDVKVIVGKDIAHPNTKEHWIQYIALWSDAFLMAKDDLEPEKAASEVVFKIKLDKTTTLSAHGYCNLHGLWHSEDVKVEVE